MRNVSLKPGRREPCSQRGVVLLDAIVAILLFSVGIVGMVALQGAATKLAGDAKLRTDAAMAADQVIAQMWVSDPTHLATYFQSPSGAGYKAWAATVTQVTAQQGLPGAAGHPPTIDVTTDPNGGNAVTVSVFWQAASDTGTHQYVTSTHIAH